MVKPGFSSVDKALTVANVAHRLISELEIVGFKRVKIRGVKAHPLTLIKKLNEETEVFLHPGVQRHGPEVLIDPIIGVNNLKLQDRLLQSPGPWKNAPRVCHAYLGMLGSWSRFYVKTEDELEVAVNGVVRSVVEVGLPVMSEYDTFDKVRKLFHDDLAHTNRVPVAVLYAGEKLERMEEH